MPAFRRSSHQPGPASGERPSLSVFVSYRRADASGHAGRLYDALSARYGTEHVFMDVDAIPAGVPFAQAIAEAVGVCDVFIALIGSSWLSSTDAQGRRRLDDPGDYVRREIETALAAQVVVVPILVQGAHLPQPHELPDSLAALVDHQSLELRDSAWRDDVARLMRQLERSTIAPTGAPGSDDATANARSPRAFHVPTSIAVAVGALLLVVAVIAAVLLTREREAQEPRGEPDERLLAVVPATIRPGCQRSESPAPGARASVSCDVASTLTATYHLFDDANVADAWYAESRIADTEGSADGPCSATEFRGQVEYRVEGRPAGRYFCFIDDGQPALTALDERIAVGIETAVFQGSGEAAAEELLELWDCCIRVVPEAGALP